MQIAACYLRVSTDDQLEYSPAAQLSALKDYAAKNGMILADEYIFKDEGISGRKADKRPGFQSMVATAKKKPRPFDVILVHRFDRFARNREDSIVYKSLLRRECGVRVVSITEPLEDDKMSVLMEAMLEAMAEYYSLNLADEVMKGMVEKAKRGETLSLVPFGYQNTGGIPCIVEAEAPIVKLIFDRIHKREMSPFTLAKYLNDAGILTRNGSGWSTQTIKQILKNPFYMGRSVWNRRSKSGGYVKARSEWVITEGKHTPLISQAVFEEVQGILQENSYRRERPAAEHCHWLSGILKCSNCGRSMSVSNGKGDYPFFQCHTYNKGKCRESHYAPVGSMEASVIAALQDFMEGNVEPAQYVTRPADTMQDNLADLLSVQLKKAEEKMIRIKAAFASGIDTMEEYGENKQKIQAEIASIRTQLASASAEADSSGQCIHIRKLLPAVLDILLSDAAATAEKNAAIKSAVSHIIFYKKAKRIEVYYFL